MNIYQKLIEVRKVVPYLQKENSGQQYKYVSSSQVLANVRAKMDELNLLLVPAVTGHEVRESAIEYVDNNGRVNKRTTTYFTELDMTMTWINADNPDEKIVCQWYGQGVDIAGEKGVGKALTYAEKYFILKQFNIATDKDDPDAFQKRHGDDADTTTGSKPEPPTTGQNTSPSGITAEDVAHVGTESSEPPPEQFTEKMVSKAQLGKINVLCGQLQINEAQGKALIEERYQKDSCGKLTSKQASNFIAYLLEKQIAKVS